MSTFLYEYTGILIKNRRGKEMNKYVSSAVAFFILSQLSLQPVSASVIETEQIESENNLQLGSQMLGSQSDGFELADGGVVSDDINYHSALSLVKQFHIFSRNAKITAHANGNVAIQNLTATSNFGTNIKGGAVELDKDIHYIQNVDTIVNSSFVKSSGNRATKVIFGKNVNLELVDNGNALAVNGTKLDNLATSEAYQDKGDNVYIDFDAVFDELSGLTTHFSQQPESNNVIKSFSDENNRYIDISQATPAGKTRVTLVNTDENNIPLVGGHYDLYNSKDEKINEEILIANSKGELQLELEAGNYYFKEVRAPQGYEPAEDVVAFQVFENKGGYIYVDVDASIFTVNRPLKILGLTTDGPSVIFNVNMAGQTSLDIQAHIKPFINGVERNSHETEDFSDAKLLWNFTDTAQSIAINNVFQGTLLAPTASVVANQNFDGSFIADNVHVSGGESHRWDFQESSETEEIAGVKVSIINKNVVQGPEEPEEPTEPEEPGEPGEEPSTPEEPEEPVNPSEPESPTEPETPVDPEEPGESGEEPSTPVNPEEPVDPSEPDSPTEPETPVDSEEPGEPAEESLKGKETVNDKKTTSEKTLPYAGVKNSSQLRGYSFYLILIGSAILFINKLKRRTK